jgi:hypothetical protein
MTASKTTRGEHKNPRTDDAHSIESHRVTASITKTEAGEVFTQYEVDGEIMTDAEQVEAALRGERA